MLITNAVGLYHGHPTYTGGSAIWCPTTSATNTALAVTGGGAFTTNYWILTTAWDADITIPAYYITPNVIANSSTVTAGRSYTVPTAANLIAWLEVLSNNGEKGTTAWTLRWAANGGAITILTNTGCTLRGNTGTPIIANGTTRTFHVRLTNLIPGSEAYEFWIL